MGLVLVASVMLISCGAKPSLDTSMPPRLRVGILPDESAARMSARYAPVIQYLESELDIPCELVIPESYDDLVQMFVDDEVDIGLFGAYTFILAHEKAGARPLVMRDIDLRFTSYFLVGADSYGESLEDFEGKVFSFGSRLSTSGHMMPRYFMMEQGIEAERFFSEVKYSGAHDKTAEWVTEGKVDIGAANSDVIRNMFNDGRLSRSDVRVLWETPPYADYVWAIDSGLSEGVFIKVRDTFLSLSGNDSEDVEILNALGTQVMLPVGMEEFEKLSGIIAGMGETE